MKSLIFTILLLSILQALNGQNWTIIPGTQIEVANIINPDKSNWNLVYFEYYRKDKKVIGVSRGMSEKFLEMFLDTPDAFDSLFKYAWFKTTKMLDTLLRRFDSSILKIDYDEAVIFERLREVHGYEEIIWELSNCTWSLPHAEPCFTNAIFHFRPNAKKNIIC